MALRKPDPLVVDSGASAPPSTRAVVPVPPGVLTVVRRLSRAWLLVAVGVFLALAGTVGIPRSPEGDGLAANVERPIQLMLLGLAAVAWLLACRWEGAAAVLLALTGTALGLLAALAHRPLVSALVCVAFLVPAAGFWFGWQHRRSRRAVTAVAVVTIVLLGGTCFGASAVYAHFFGPAHPVSSQPALPVDRVVWSWSGAMTTSSAIVVAQLTPGSRQARLVVEPESGGPTVVTRYADPVGAAVVRLAVDGLAPGTGYRYAIEIDGTADGGRGVGRLRTMPLGPASFTVAVGACAGTASNGAVFDAIANTRPLLYIQAGDLHYGNPDRNDINAFGALYRRALTAPAQAALYRSVPVACGWDDHDYGPNDADATAATRTTAPPVTPVSRCCTPARWIAPVASRAARTARARSPAPGSSAL